jgi:hypothetical protein
MANLTQSTGVPETVKRAMSPSSLRGRNSKGRVQVKEQAWPERGPSGATTMMRPKPRSEFVKAEIPRASMPSSFVTRINGLVSDSNAAIFINDLNSGA